MQSEELAVLTYSQLRGMVSEAVKTAYLQAAQEFRKILDERSSVNVLYNVEEAAKRMSISKGTLYKMCQDRKIDYVPSAKGYYISDAAIGKFIDSQTVKAK